MKQAGIACPAAGGAARGVTLAAIPMPQKGPLSGRQLAGGRSPSFLFLRTGMLKQGHVFSSIRLHKTSLPKKIHGPDREASAAA
jgi:hypothetical protein